MYRRSFIDELIWFLAGVFCLAALSSAREPDFILDAYVADGCGPCVAWKRDALPVLDKLETLCVRVTNNHPQVKSFPLFVVRYRGGAAHWSGYSNWTTHRRKLSDAIATLMGIPNQHVLRTPIRSFLLAISRPGPVAYEPRQRYWRGSGFW